MATSDETIDPNDLDSIDALLDEAELDVVEKNDTSTSEAEKDAIDSLLDDVKSDSETLPLSEPEKEEPLFSEQEETPVEEPVQKSVSEVEKKQPDVKKTVSDHEKPSLKKAPLKTEMTVEEMDSIKKLIIIFGAVLTVLALIGIGIGVWSALAAKSSALDEETLTLIESIQVNTERVAVNAENSNQSIKTLEKKLDALNFQLEGVTTDLLEAQSTAPSDQKKAIIDPLGLNESSTHIVSTAKPTPVEVNTDAKLVQQVALADSESLKLATSVNKKMISAQRRIDEVNRRVKDIQSKHKALLLSIKSLEKQMLLQQKKLASKERVATELKQKQTHNPYQYSAPDDSYYDQSVGDSYP